MWILALPLTALALSVGVYGLLWLIERGGDEYPAKLPLSDKGATNLGATEPAQGTASPTERAPGVKPCHDPPSFFCSW